MLHPLSAEAQGLALSPEVSFPSCLGEVSEQLVYVLGARTQPNLKCCLLLLPPRSSQVRGPFALTQFWAGSAYVKGRKEHLPWDLRSCYGKLALGKNLASTFLSSQRLKMPNSRLSSSKASMRGYKTGRVRRR